MDNNLTIKEVQDGLEELVHTLVDKKVAVSESARDALLSALTVISNLRTLQFVIWNACPADSDGKPIPGVPVDARAALFFSNDLAIDEFQRILESDEIEEDPRVILTTLEKATAFLNNFGFLRLNKE